MARSKRYHGVREPGLRLARRGDRHDERERDVDQAEESGREDRPEDEPGAHLVDTQFGVGGEAVAHAGELLSLADLLETAAARGHRDLLGHRVVASVDRADLLEDAVDVGGGDQDVAGNERRLIGLSEPLSSRRPVGHSEGQSWRKDKHPNDIAPSARLG